MSTSASSSGKAAWREPTKEDKPPKDADLPEAWAFLKVGVEHIMTRLHLGMSYSYYILLYTAIYDFCTASRPTAGHGATRGGASLQGSELYKSLHVFLSNHCKRLREESDTLSDHELLKFYAKEWDRYTTGATYVNKLFNYLNKHWVKREKEEGRKEVYTVYTLALVAWKNNFFNHFANQGGVSRLTQAILRQIEHQRNGEVVDSGLLKQVIESYVSLGIDQGDYQRANLDVYKEHFQTPFLAATRQYYKNESSLYVVANSVSDYMKKAEDRLDEEAQRVTLYLNDSTRKDLKETCERVLVSDHAELLWDEFQALLDADRLKDLTRMYALLSRIPTGLEPLRRQFEEHVKRAGLAAVQRVLPAAGAVNEAGKAEVLDPKSYIEALLEVHGKFGEVVDGPFRAELGFNASLDKACRDFCNTNAACTSPTKSPELLASYCDQMLRKSNKDLDGESVENALNQAMIIFRYIDDKDVFQKFYQKKLALRLIGQLSASDDSESSMITKLKELSGFEYTNKLTRMFTDMNLSRDLTEKFKEKERNRAASSDIDFTAMILGANFWPIVPAPTNYAVPREIQSTYDAFTKYHSEVHSGRKLTWLWHVMKAELRTTYLPQKYIFMTNAYQMAILCQFNENDSLSLQDLLSGTQLQESVLNAQLGLLVKAKILLQDGNNYDLNLNFKSKKLKVNLNQPVKSEQKAEATEVLAAVDEDRKFVYQATIVRLMKARKTMKHQALIQEVTAQISTKFTPKVSEIKKAIDLLLDKEYLERDEGQKDSYSYLA
ncbi:putative ubiquitin-protein ligase [Kockovaella imperatae]|uniref:Cullin-1 n=1 Tax=Kockovaella imperatae TaxID=4999 RepID=A0A1Y1UGG7_9TREE|nr:putative ubiquitin-protein ligase [Kockovaella imperatae]ORX37122.1 putative ubiquitin-protein ligase [Kockovaella imperatae]